MHGQKTRKLDDVDVVKTSMGSSEQELYDVMRYPRESVGLLRAFQMKFFWKMILLLIHMNGDF